MADIILGIESSCDDTSAAVIRDGWLLSNVIASQEVHKSFGGVVPELASRAHEMNIVPVVSEALSRAGVSASDLTAIAFTRGPGLLGSLLVGTSFAKTMALSLDIPLVMVNHLQGHILAGFVKQEGSENRQPSFPYLCLLVSGGNSQIVRVDSPLDFTILGQTIDDAVGEAFDKCSKMMGLGYPGGPIIDALAKKGDPKRFTFAKPHVEGLDYSFRVHGKEQGRHLRLFPEMPNRYPYGQAHKGCKADRDKGNHNRRRSVGQQQSQTADSAGRREAQMERISP